jgi:hypothetical protein
MLICTEILIQFVCDCLILATYMYSFTPYNAVIGHGIICVYMEFGPCIYLYTHHPIRLLGIKQCW